MFIISKRRDDDRGTEVRGVATVQEAASFLGVPATTFRGWLGPKGVSARAFRAGIRVERSGGIEYVECIPGEPEEVTLYHSAAECAKDLVADKQAHEIMSALVLGERRLNRYSTFSEQWGWLNPPGILGTRFLRLKPYDPTDEHYYVYFEDNTYETYELREAAEWETGLSKSGFTRAMRNSLDESRADAAAPRKGIDSITKGPDPYLADYTRRSDQ